ncbi:hypothetical protein GORBP_132_00010 [Gordonia rubripertincta NBRC 101908]|uniref:Uncharacterized protein n=1 Tax=Gordonia rubripertincta NBRC 101908 TaxID=1077975 RepID=A0ABQ0I0L3_GORRU|nr:hypothetical protein GORBP_132_00010 [Gordonia rubripertincta NBRC 101908]
MFCDDAVQAAVDPSNVSLQVAAHPAQVEVSPTARMVWTVIAWSTPSTVWTPRALPAFRTDRDDQQLAVIVVFNGDIKNHQVLDLQQLLQ